MWIQGSSDSDKVQSAGEVGKEDVIVSWTEAGFKLVANSYPIPVSVSDLIFNTGDIYMISIQTLSKGGKTVDDIYWNDWTEYPAGSGEYGFWDDGSDKPTEFQIQPGQALWIQASAGDSLRIPAPEL